MVASSPPGHSSSPRLILASASPRRKSLLAEAGYTFTVHPAEIDETNYPPGLTPSELVRHLAMIKADAVAERFPEAVVLAADTLVAFGDQVLGKPADADDARRMLQLLSSTTQLVLTGVAVVHQSAGISRSLRVMSAVRMRPLTRREIDEYVASNQWQGKAGGYGIQDQDPFVEHVSGDYTNIVGLPIPATKQLLSEAGIEPNRV